MNNPSFISYLSDKKYTPHSSIIKSLDDKDFPFMKNTFFNHNPAFMAADEFNRCVSLYKEKSLNSNLDDLKQLIALMIFYEDDVRDKLQKCAVNCIRDLYDIPDKIQIKTSIEWTETISGPKEESKSKKDKLTNEQIHNVRYEIEKRRIINTIIHGSAIHQWTSVFFLIQDEINALSPALMGIYKQYVALINYLNWLHPLSNNNTATQYMMNQSVNIFDQIALMIQGTSSINYKQKTIEAVGISFPVLIHELLKSVTEYIMAVGLPNHLEENEMKYVLEKADAYQHEYWHYYLGPCLWRAILNSAQVEAHDLPKILSAFAKMDYGDLSQICLQITFDPEDTGKKSMNKLKKELRIR